MSVGLQPTGPALLVLAQLELRLVGPVGLLAGHRHHPRVGPGRPGSPAPAKHPPALPLGVVGGGEKLQGLVGLGPPDPGPGKLPGPVPGRLVQQAAQPVPLGPQLGRRQPPQVQTARSVHRQPLVADPRHRLGELGVAVTRITVGQVQLGWPLRLGPDHRVQGGLMPSPGQLHIQPMGVLGAGEADQRPPAGQPLGAVAGGGIGQVDPAVPLATLAAVQIPAGQGHLPRLLPIHPDG